MRSVCRLEDGASRGQTMVLPRAVPSAFRMRRLGDGAFRGRTVVRPRIVPGAFRVCRLEDGASRGQTGASQDRPRCVPCVPIRGWCASEPDSGASQDGPSCVPCVPAQGWCVSGPDWCAPGFGRARRALKPLVLGRRSHPSVGPDAPAAPRPSFGGARRALKTPILGRKDAPAAPRPSFGEARRALKPSVLGRTNNRFRFFPTLAFFLNGARRRGIHGGPPRENRHASAALL